MLLKTVPRVLARSVCRWAKFFGPGTKSALEMRSTILVMVLRPNCWEAIAATRITAICKGAPLNQSQKLFTCVNLPIVVRKFPKKLPGNARNAGYLGARFASQRKPCAARGSN